MRTAPQPSTPATRSHQPRAFTVFAAAFVAGAAAAVGVNSVLDVRLSQAKPKVESEPIFVALRSLPQGAPVTVWDVALRDWPRAMVPTSALRASDTFSGLVLKHPLREGQPLLAVQLVETDTVPAATLSVTSVSTAPAALAGEKDADLWAPAEPTVPAAATAMPAQQHQDSPPQETARPQPDAQAAIVPVQAAPPVPMADAAAPSTEATRPAPPSAPVDPVAVEQPQPNADETVAAGREQTGTAMQPAVAVDRVADGVDDGRFDAVTDEMLEAMAATAAPPAPSADGPIGSGQPQPAQEPTLADPPLATIDSQADEPGAPASVMRPESAAVPPARVPAPPRIATRYLVVPESIALQADASFASARQTAPQAQPDAPAGTVKPLPPTTAATDAGRPAGQALQQRSVPPGRGTSAAAPATGRRPAEPPAAAESSQRRTMFPNIAAGIETIEGEVARMRRERSGQTAPPAATRARPQY